MNKVCCIFNTAAHYRKPIYKLIDQHFNCDFYIGDKVSSPMKMMDYSELSGFKKELKNIYLIGNIYWQKGALKTVFSDYKHFIITGEPHCLSTWLILLLSRLTTKKSYLWTHGWYGRETKVKKIVKKLFFGLSSHVLLYGDYARNLMIKEGYNPNKLHCIYNSLDFDHQREIREKLNKSDIFKSHFKNDWPTICYVGRIQKSKKIYQLIDALNLLKQTEIRLNMVIVGKEVGSTNLQEYVIQEGLDANVWFYGETYDEIEIGNIFFNSSLCVSPGNVGLTAIHSLTYGCPVITHNNFSNQGPEFEAITKGVTGDFFEEDDIEDLALKIAHWLNIIKNSEAEVRKNCNKIIDQRYNPHFQIELLSKLIQ